MTRPPAQRSVRHGSAPRTTGDAPGGARAVRSRLGLHTVVVVAAMTLSAFLLLWLGQRHEHRFDLTSTRQHELSPRSKDLLARLTGEYDVVCAGDLASLPATTQERTRDVLDAFAAASPRVKITMLDTRSAKGLSDYDAFVRSLADRNAVPLRAARARVDTLLDDAATIAAFLNDPDTGRGVSAELAAIEATVTTPTAESDTIREYLRSVAALSRTTAVDLSAAVARSRSLLADATAHPDLAPTDLAAAGLAPALNAAATLIDRIDRDLGTIIGSASVDPATKDRATPLHREITRTRRDEAARLLARAQAEKPISILSVARTLERSDAILIVGPPNPRTPDAPSVNAIEFANLFSTGRDAASDQTIDQRHRVEELLATAIGTLNDPAPPILVFVHGARTRAGPDFKDVRAITDRFRTRGVDILEWPVAVEPEPPALSTLDPAGERPVVYVAIGPQDTSADGVRSLSAFAAAIARILNNGDSLLLALAPSELPASGAPDPVAAALSALGINWDTARPLLSRVASPQGAIVVPDVIFTDAHADHPVSASILGLPTRFTWATALESSTNPRMIPILRVPTDASLWAEAEWLQFSRLPAAQRPRLVPQPSPDSAHDRATPAPDAFWTLAVSAERQHPDRPRTQRIVITGCNLWFIDHVAAAARVIDGKTSLNAPGNIELFEACFYWLAHQDHYIGRSALTASIPVIRPITPSQAAVLRWTLIAGLPALVLILGAAWRLLRG